MFSQCATQAPLHKGYISYRSYLASMRGSPAARDASIVHSCLNSGNSTSTQQQNDTYDSAIATTQPAAVSHVHSATVSRQASTSSFHSATSQNSQPELNPPSKNLLQVNPCVRAPRVHPSSADATTLNAVFGGAMQIAPARKSMQRTSSAAAVAAYRETRGQGGAIWKEEDSKGSRSKSSAIGLTVEQRRVVCQQSIDAISAAATHHNIGIDIGTVNYVCDDDTVLGIYVKLFLQVEDSARLHHTRVDLHLHLSAQALRTKPLHPP